MTSGLQLVGGLVALIVGAEVLVRAGTGLASWLGIRPMMIGLTVVSLGTSVPELAVGIDAAVSGNPGLAVGNIVGTNFVNLLLILGVSAVLVSIALDRATLRFDLPVMMAPALLLSLLSIDGTVTTRDGVVLLLGGWPTRPVWCGSAGRRPPTWPKVPRLPSQTPLTARTTR